MRVVSVNVGAKTTLNVGGREKQTGIFKQPVSHDVEVKTLGITGDQVLDRKHHGGPDQALYLYRVEDYDYWAEALGRDIEPGTFGENLTVAGLPGPGLDIGDRLQSAGLELEITAPRIPCSVFAARMGAPSFLKAFIKAERPGFYVRVLTPGKVAAGDEFRLKPTDLDSISTVQLYRDVQGKLDIQTIRRYLELPIDIRTRTDFEAQLSKQGV